MHAVRSSALAPIRGLCTAHRQTFDRRLAPGVNYCTELGSADVNVLINVTTTYKPLECRDKVQKNSHLLLHYTGAAAPSADADASQWQQFVAVEDFTVAHALQMGAGEVSTYAQMLTTVVKGARAVSPPRTH